MILVVGDAGVDISVRISHAPLPDEKVHASTSRMAAGGVALNTAIVLRRLGSCVSLAAEIGVDVLGDFVESTLIEETVATDSLVRNPRISTYSTFSMLVGDDAEKRMVVMPTASLYPGSVEHLNLADVTWCHTAPFGFAAAGVLVERCRRDGIPFSLDLEPATLDDRADQIVHLTRGADTVIVNERSSRRLGSSPGEAVEEITGRLAAKTAIVTLGGQGVVYGHSRNVQELPAYDVATVDTTGAGDAFAAGYLRSRTEGGSVPDAVRFAGAAGAIACTRLGARGALVDEREIQQLQGQSKEAQR